MEHPPINLYRFLAGKNQSTENSIATFDYPEGNIILPFGLFHIALKIANIEWKFSFHLPIWQGLCSNMLNLGAGYHHILITMAFRKVYHIFGQLKFGHQVF